jgi:hypothetical protein
MWSIPRTCPCNKSAGPLLRRRNLQSKFKPPLLPHLHYYDERLMGYQTQRQSIDFKALQDPCVIQARQYARQHSCRGIKVKQAIDYVGVSRSNLEQRFLKECGHSIYTAIYS